MNLDLILFGLVLLFAVIGAFAGAAKQIAHLVAMVAAYVAARPGGELLGPTFTQALKSPPTVGQVAATLVVFIATLVVLRMLLTLFLRRLLAGRDPHDRKVDRALGFILGGTKVGLIIYVIVCALTFVEQNVVVAGRKLGVSPQDSAVFALARKYNVFELAQFSAVKDLVAVAQASRDPEKLEKIAEEPEFTEVQKDPRFQKLLKDDATRKAVESGDYQSLLKSSEVLKLIQDPTFAQKLAEIAKLSEQRFAEHP